MFLLLTNVNPSVKSKTILTFIISLGVPTEMFRALDNRGTWALKMKTHQDAADAEWVLSRHLEISQEKLGGLVTIQAVASLPENVQFDSRRIHGKAEA